MVYIRNTVLKWMIWGYHHFRKLPYGEYPIIYKVFVYIQTVVVWDFFHDRHFLWPIYGSFTASESRCVRPF